MKALVTEKNGKTNVTFLTDNDYASVILDEIENADKYEIVYVSKSRDVSKKSAELDYKFKNFVTKMNENGDSFKLSEESNKAFDELSDAVVNVTEML